MDQSNRNKSVKTATTIIILVKEQLGMGTKGKKPTGTAKTEIITQLEAAQEAISNLYNILSDYDHQYTHDIANIDQQIVDLMKKWGISE